MDTRSTTKGLRSQKEKIFTKEVAFKEKSWTELGIGMKGKRTAGGSYGHKANQDPSTGMGESRKRCYKHSQVWGHTPSVLHYHTLDICRYGVVV